MLAENVPQQLSNSKSNLIPFLIMLVSAQYTAILYFIRKGQ